MQLNDFDAILFDMDGTLVDSESLWRIAESATVAHFGATLEPELQKKFTGLRVEKTSEMMRDTYKLNASVAQIVDKIHTHVKTLLPEVKDKSGAVTLIESVVAKGIPKAIVSNSMTDIIETTLAHKDWANHFDLRFSAEQVKHAKPAPDLYLLAAQTLQVAPERCLVFEDSLTGVKAALAAHMTCIAIPEYPDQAFTALTPYVFDSLDEALAFLTL